MPYARVGGIDLYYEEHGTGPRVLVMTHGALGSVQFAETSGLSASAIASRGLRVVAYDARGHGRSGYKTAESDYDKRALAEELRSLLDVLGLTRVSICGTSMGATTALLLAQAHPERVERLVLRSPAPFGDGMIAVRRALGALALSYQVLGTSLTARIAALRPNPIGPERTRILMKGQRRASIVPALRAFPAEPLDTALLHTIKAPTLILTQPADSLHPLESGEILYDQLTQSTLCVAPTAAFWHEHPDETGDLIAAFVHDRNGDGFEQDLAVAQACTFKSRTGADSSRDA